MRAPARTPSENEHRRTPQQVAEIGYVVGDVRLPVAARRAPLTPLG
ncbi:MAG TPA: hypothetical protein VMU32_11050 [Solirubrobacteraceae bacterium]|nr:hypothetical protein [Solirubrobacteraceae bacterium]